MRKNNLKYLRVILKTFFNSTNEFLFYLEPLKKRSEIPRKPLVKKSKN